MPIKKLPAPRKRGQPTKFRPEFNEQVRELCLLGATDENIARFFKVTETTVNNWKKDYPDFFESVKEAKAEADAKVASSLYNRAIGYEHDDVKIFMPANYLAPVYAPFKAVVQPDVTAAIFWLKNRQAKEWREKIEADITSGGEKITPIYGGISVQGHDRDQKDL